MKSPIFSKLILPILAFAVFTGSGFGIEIREYDASRHDRFVDFPSDLTFNPDFYQGAEDWSGFGWSVQDTRRHFTLVSPKHFLGARHFRPNVGHSIRFVNRDGEVKTFTVKARHDILNDDATPVASDLFVGELEEVVTADDKISIVPVFNLTDPNNYIGQDLIISGRSSRAGLGTVASLLNFSGNGINNTRGLRFNFIEPGVGDDDCRLVSGDSGGPSKVLTSDGFALLGTHSAIAAPVDANGSTTYSSFDALVPHYLDRLDERLTLEGYHIQRANGTVPNLTYSVAESGDPVLSSQGLSYTFTIENRPRGEEAHNLRIALDLSGATVASISGADWVLREGEGSFELLLGGLGTRATTTVTVNLDLPNTPIEDVVLTGIITSDGSPDFPVSESALVAQSYQSWSSGLNDTALDADPDGDGLINEVEYLLGRDGGVAEGAPLRFELVNGGLTVSYQERDFLGFSDSDLVLETSTDLENWDDVEGLNSQSVGYQLNEFSAVLSDEVFEFFRLRVDELTIGIAQ